MQFKSLQAAQNSVFKMTYVLLGERVDELREDLVGDDGLSKLVGVVGEATESQSSGLLDGGHIIEEEGSQESHNA